MKKRSHGPSEIVDPGDFAWTDTGWRGVARERHAIAISCISAPRRDPTHKVPAKYCSRCAFSVVSFRPRPFLIRRSVLPEIGQVQQVLLS
jgi:hypothetical protein